MNKNNNNFKLIERNLQREMPAYEGKKVVAGFNMPQKHKHKKGCFLQTRMELR